MFCFYKNSNSNRIEFSGRIVGKNINNSPYNCRQVNKRKAVISKQKKKMGEKWKTMGKRVNGTKQKGNT